MRRLAWERYVPDVEDNRARHARGEPAIVVQLRPPTARVWSRFWLAIAESPKWSALLHAKRVELGEETGTGLTLHLALFDETLAEILWRPSVGPIEGLHPEGGEPIPSGEALWTLRDTLDSPEIYLDILRALILRTTLVAGLADFLASVSGRPAFPSAGDTRDGIAASAAQPA